MYSYFVVNEKFYSFCVIQTEDGGQVEQRPILSQRNEVRAIGFIEALKIPVSAEGRREDKQYTRFCRVWTRRSHKSIAIVIIDNNFAV